MQGTEMGSMLCTNSQQSSWQYELDTTTQTWNLNEVLYEDSSTEF